MFRHNFLGQEVNFSFQELGKTISLKVNFQTCFEKGQLKKRCHWVTTSETQKSTPWRPFGSHVYVDSLLFVVSCEPYPTENVYFRQPIAPNMFLDSWRKGWNMSHFLWGGAQKPPFLWNASCNSTKCFWVGFVEFCKKRGVANCFARCFPSLFQWRGWQG